MLREAVVGSGSEVGPAQSVLGKSEGEFLIEEVGTSEEQGSVGLSSVACEDKEGIGDGQSGSRHEFVERIVKRVATGSGGEVRGEQDGDAMAVGEGFELVQQGQFLLGGQTGSWD